MNIVILVASLVAFVYAVYMALGVVVIGDQQVGIVTKKFSNKNLPAGRYVATDGEAGIQADTLSPGWHFFKWSYQFKIEKVPMVRIEPGFIGVVVAADGSSIPSNRILGKIIDSNNFQDVNLFIKNGGEKGKQLGILTPGFYRINTKVFTVQSASVTAIASGMVGVVTIADGEPLSAGEIAGTILDGHNNFQNPQKFLELGGKRGLQEQVILAGQWNLNPWFALVKQVPMTEIPIGFVGVVTSYVGKEHIDVSGEGFKHGDLVEKGHKGVWSEPLYNGLHPLNTDTTKVYKVPTTNVVLNWANNRNESHMLDKNLSSITVRSKDGFSYNLDVSVIIHVGAKKASSVISRMGSMENLISQVLEPAIANYFRNSAQNFSALDFLKERTNMQTNAAKFVREALSEYDIEAVDTLIGDIVLPQALLETQTQRKVAEEMEKTFKVQQSSMKEKESLQRQIALTDIQTKIVASEQDVRISQLQAEQQVKKAEGDTKVAEQKSIQMVRIATAEADSLKLKANAEASLISQKAIAEAQGIEAKGAATAAAYTAGVKAMGEGNFTLLETMGVIGKEKVKLIPDMVIGNNGGSADGQNGGNGVGMINALMALMLRDNFKPAKDSTEKKA